MVMVYGYGEGQSQYQLSTKPEMLVLVLNFYSILTLFMINELDLIHSNNIKKNITSLTTARHMGGDDERPKSSIV